MDERAGPGILAEPEWLAAHLDDAGVRVIDCGSATPSWDPPQPPDWDGFIRSHIPGARPLNVHNWVKDPSHRLVVLRPQRFRAAMEGLGVSNETTVVVYDRVAGLYASRLWWALAYHGHDRTRALDGGLARWLADGWPVTEGDGAAPGRGRFIPELRPALACDRREIRERLHDPEFRLLDTRSAEEFAGTKSAGNRRVGHIPGAVHLDWKELLTAGEQLRLRPVPELARKFEVAGLEKGDEIVTYCQAGVRAAFAALVLTALGWPHVRVYDASMAEWANRDDTPMTVVGDALRRGAA